MSPLVDPHRTVAVSLVVSDIWIDSGVCGMVPYEYRSTPGGPEMMESQKELACCWRYIINDLWLYVDVEKFDLK